MSVDAKTIQIFLPDGEPRGIRIAEITTRIVQAVQVPRARLDRIMERPELEHIAAYFLFGDFDERAKPVAYVGQTEDLRKRLKKHHAEREFWTTAVFLISKTGWNDWKTADGRTLDEVERQQVNRGALLLGSVGTDGDAE